MAAGTYTLTNGELQMGKVSGSNITLTGAGAASTIISGNNASRVFDLDPSIIGGVTTSISGVTITNGAVTTFGGAGIIAGSGNAGTKDTLTISNCTIIEQPRQLRDHQQVRRRLGVSRRLADHHRLHL